MDLKDLQRNWDGLGATDPLWAILSDPSKRGNKWDLAEFFRSGEHEIAATMTSLQALGLSVNPNAALDFGCGVGRLTQALSRRFESVYGVDIAPSMIEQAKRLNTSDKCRFLVNQRDDLNIFPSEYFDFIYTVIVLQHMEPCYSKKYLGEFLRTLKHGGVLFLELPDRLRSLVPLDPAAYDAQIQILAAPDQVAAGEYLTVQAMIRNLGPITWPGQCRATNCLLQLGNHWLTPSGAIDISDDARTPLPCDLEPGASVELTLLARAPLRSGSYLLELDLVHEGVRWFGQNGSRTARRLIRVTPADVASLAQHFSAGKNVCRNSESRTDGRKTKRLMGLRQSFILLAHAALKRCAKLSRKVMAPANTHVAAIEDEFKMEMHGVPRDEVHEIIFGAGCRVVHEAETSVSGPEWIAYTYVVLKP